MIKTLLRSERKLKSISIESIIANPDQPRKFFDETSIIELGESIKEYGIINPLTVKRTEKGYQLIAGERRLRAAKLIGLTAVPCIIMDSCTEGSAVLAIIENIQRRDLDFFEEAESYKALIEKFNLTQQEIGQKLGKNQSSIANKLRILRLSSKNIQLIRENSLTERHARAILRIEEEVKRIEVTNYIIKQQLNVGQTEEYIDYILSDKEEKPHQKIKAYIKDVRIFINTIDKALKTMQNSGILADVEKQEEGDDIYLKIHIEKAVKK